MRAREAALDVRGCNWRNKVKQARGDTVGRVRTQGLFVGADAAFGLGVRSLYTPPISALALASRWSAASYPKRSAFGQLENHHLATRQPGGRIAARTSPRSAAATDGLGRWAPRHGSVGTADGSTLFRYKTVRFRPFKPLDLFGRDRIRIGLDVLVVLYQYQILAVPAR